MLIWSLSKVLHFFRQTKSFFSNLKIVLTRNTISPCKQRHPSPYEKEYLNVWNSFGKKHKNTKYPIKHKIKCRKSSVNRNIAVEIIPKFIFIKLSFTDFKWALISLFKKNDFSSRFLALFPFILLLVSLDETFLICKKSEKT